MSEDFGDDFITLVDDDGQEFELELLDTLEMDGETYKAFTPARDDAEADDDEDIDIIILKVVVEDNEETFDTIENDDELDRVYELFMERIDDEDAER